MEETQKKALRDAARLTKSAEDVRAGRDRAIAMAHELGSPYQAIADATGLSKARVAQIVVAEQA